MGIISRIRLLAILLAAAAACAGGIYCYYEHLPAQRAKRLLQQADEQMQELYYKEAEGMYDEIMRIDPENLPALEGKIKALFGQADALASSAELSGQSEACALYREILSLEENRRPADMGGSEKTEAEEKLSGLEKKMAAACKTVAYDIKRVEDPETAAPSREPRPEGEEAACIRYYDLVQVTDAFYPYSERINEVLRRQMEGFFSESLSESGQDPSPAAQVLTEEGDLRDYVGVSGAFNGNGILSIRMARVRARGKSLSKTYCGMTFRLSDAEPLTLMDVTGRNGQSLKKLLCRRLWTYLQAEGYRSVSKSDVEKYVEDTEPEDFPFCLRDEGEVCLVIDRQASFFSSGEEILEIPLQ